MITAILRNGQRVQVADLDSLREIPRMLVIRKK